MVGIIGSVGGLFGDYKGLERDENFGRKYEVYRGLSLCRVAEVVEGGDLFIPQAFRGRKVAILKIFFDRLITVVLFGRVKIACDYRGISAF